VSATFACCLTHSRLFPIASLSRYDAVFRGADETTRFSSAFGRCGDSVATGRTRAAPGDADDRVLEQRVTASVSASGGRLSTGLESNRICRGTEWRDRMPVGGGSQ